VTGKVIGIAVVLLALGAGLAVAATQTAASDGTNICVNDTNGLMREAETCRDGEHALLLGGGGGGSVRVTQDGSLTVPWGGTGSAKVLPLTGVTISGQCDVFSAPFGLAMRHARDVSPLQQEGVFDTVRDWPALGLPFALGIIGRLDG
jgi:hypothetical protein